MKDYEIVSRPLVLGPIHKWIRNYCRYDKLSLKDKDYFLLLLLTGAFKQCDHLSSAFVKEIPILSDFDFNFLERKKTKLEEEGKSFYGHQVRCGTEVANVMLTAPTGSGKTEASMLWLKNQVEQNGQGRVFYILPYTASINAMFERLSHELPRAKVGMLHGKLDDYLNQYFEDQQYETKRKKAAIAQMKENFERLNTPVKIITPFQLLKHIFGLKGFEKGMFEWVGGYFIFDEIHAYDASVIAQIKVFLEFATTYLKSKVFIMTATLPPFIRAELELAAPFQLIHADKTLYKSFTRHQVTLLNGRIEENLDQIWHELKSKKVLVVCNTVKQSQSVFKKLSEGIENESILLHGAFNGNDRRSHEQDLLDSEEKGKPGIKLLVGTQALEVSLDIDFDVIFTEPAPIDALFQRFGRVNRKREKGIVPVFVCTNRNEWDKFIYPPEIVDKTIEVFESISREKEGVIDESKMEQYVKDVYPNWRKADRTKFELIYDSLKYSLEHLSPMFHDDKNEDSFYEQFDGIKVLPANKEIKVLFEEAIYQFDFVKAETYKVNIRSQKFAQLRKQSTRNLKFKKIYIEKNEKLIPIAYWQINKKYDRKLGLLYDEQEEW